MSDKASGQIPPISPEEDFARAQAARWLLRLMDSQMPLAMNDCFFILLAWIGEGLPALARSMGAMLLAQLNKRSREHAKGRRAVKEMLDANIRRYDDSLEELYEDYEFLREPIKRYIHEFLQQRSRCKGSHPLFARIRKVFGISGKALEFCFFAFVLEHYRQAEHYFEDTLSLHEFDRRHQLGAMFGLNGAAVQDLRLSIEDMGILESIRRHGAAIRLSENVERLVQAPRSSNLQDIFCRKLPRATVPFDQFHMDPEVARHALTLMGSKGAKPVHLLLYGAPGAGKTSFAITIAQELGVKAWAVQCGEGDDTQDRRASLTACLKLAANSEGAFVLVDEAERLLDSSRADITEGSSKAWINDLLERKNTRIIWITNTVEHLDPAVRRRFSYSIHFRQPDRLESIAMWNSVAERTGVTKLFPPEERKRFASLWRVPVASMESALLQAKAHAGKKDFVSWVERAIRAQVTLQNDGRELMPDFQEEAAGYDPDGVCAKIPVCKIIERSKKLAASLERAPEPGLGSMLFYGPPGSGKTALARHLARELDKELIVKKASDLIDPYVGMTERNIAEAFASARRNNALLLIDEADSFIFDRAAAVRSWEQTMTNEFLTQLENFAGLCICTTNMRENLDTASMRRFTAKVEFGYLNAAQIERLYARLLAPYAKDGLTARTREILLAQKRLVPGDFQAVRKKFLWLEDEASHRQLVEALIEEQSLKKDCKQVGFQV